MKNKKLFAILTLVCFMFTLMPMAAFAAPVDGKIAASMSSIIAADTEVGLASVANASDREGAQMSVSMRTVNGALVPAGATTTLYVWVTKEGSNIPVNTVSIGTVDTNGVYTANQAAGQYVYAVADVTTAEKQFAVGFNAAGTFQVHASAVQPEITSGRISGADEFNNNAAVVTVTSTATKASELTAQITANGSTSAMLEDGETSDVTVNVNANNVDEKEVTVYLYKLGNVNQPQAGKTLKIQTSGAITADKATVTTNAFGKATFKVAGTHEGTYKIYVSCGQFEITIPVTVGANAATTIELTKSPEYAIDILNTDLTAGIDDVEFQMYDVNGNVVNPELVPRDGWDKAYGSASSTLSGYVAVVSQPSGSKLENKHLSAVDISDTKISIASSKQITVEGDYEFKVVLNNGNYATVKFTVKAFTTPVSLNIEFPEAAELGATVVADDLYWLDANHVKKSAEGKVDVAATGYAIANFDADTNTLTVKTDEKYVGSEITVTAVDTRYNLVGTDVITVASDAKNVVFADKTAEVKVNNKIKAYIKDESGKVVALGNRNSTQNSNVEVSLVILDQPENARAFVSATDKDKLISDGYFTMNLTSNVVGNVTVQAVVKYSYVNTATNANVVKYYTGTQIFAVGNGSVGKVVVMSVGSNEIIINDAKAAIDAAPMVANNRTFVPFRALAEAFGATVAYDEATQSVTAELNGVKVVMTIGSATYTVNGVEKAADVAPFINGSRTMVPVRFVAEAFGIKVIPTYDQNGATADILFNL